MTNKGKKAPPAPKKQGMAMTSQVQSLSQKVDALTKRIPPGTFAKVGASLGALAGPKGAALGGAVGAGLARITGRGDYAVQNNTLAREGGTVDSVPKFVDINKHTVRISHREFLGNVTAPPNPAAFANTTYVINAGDSRTFPWLSPISKSYSQYRIKGMVFCYKSTFSDYAATGSLGTVIMATNYNVADNSYTTKIAMENSEFAVSCKPSLSMMHPIECAPEFGARGEPYYVRDLSAINNTVVSDNRFYDLGLFQIATEGLACAANTVLGELWVSYELELIRPLISPNYNFGSAGLILDTTGTGYGIGLGALATNLIPTYVTTSGDAKAFQVVATNATVPDQDTCVAFVAAASGVINQNLKFCKNGQYYIVENVRGTGITVGSNVITVPSGSAQATFVQQDVSFLSTHSQNIWTLYVTGINGPQDYVIVNTQMGAAATTITDGLIEITVISGRPALRTGF